MHALMIAAAGLLAGRFQFMVRAQATVPVSYDTVYDNCSASLSTVACSSQLESLGYDTFGSLPDFPFIGGAAVVTPYGSGECGSCWELSYQGNRITVLAIDYTDQGFNIAEEAFDVLTNGQAQSLGRLEAVATQVNISACGL